MLGSLILYLKGMRIMMFQLSGFYYTYTPESRQAQTPRFQGLGLRVWGSGFRV